ncbi:MAG: helicase-associated domain-containing protein [Anaerolineales bacterium]|nr:helicase-associated domain-containing protein [Anaerolineales bacterium]
MVLKDLLDQWTSDKLKTFVYLLGGTSSINRKDDRRTYICIKLLKPETLRQIWQQLDPIAQRAVSVAYHNDGLFDASAFVAQYGELPPRPQKDKWHSYHREPILFDLFVIDGQIPEDLRPLLTNLVLPAERFQLTGIERLPATVFQWNHNWEIIRADTELIGRTDLLTYLQMVDQGELKWSATKNDLTAASIRKVLNNLLSGDFHPEQDKVTGRTVIRPFGLDVFTQDSGLVTRTGKLTGAGRQYLQTQDADLFLEAFEKWSTQGKFDELTRITGLNGLSAKGTRLTSPASRREKVIEALSWCPTHTWISIFDFYRAVLIWQFDFAVEATEWSNLYAGSYKEYGYMDATDYWRIVKGLSINAIIMEYLATIGAVDIAYVSDDVSFADVGGHYTDAALSLHDGLLYFRINNWGAFLLGQADSYVPTVPPTKDLFTIDEARQVRLLDNLLPNERLLLELITEPVNETTYQLDVVKLLTAVEQGQNLDYLTDFLSSNVQGQLPVSVAQWLAQLGQNLGAVKVGETAVLIQIKDPALLDLLQQDSQLAKLCEPHNSKTVLVLSKRLTRFRSRLKELGYLLA